MFFKSLSPREKVYAVIESERQYQDRRWGVRIDGDPEAPQFNSAPHSVGEFLLYINHYVTKANAEASEKEGDTATLEMLRKIAGLCVACFEQHECPARDLTKPITNARDGKKA